jgi:hypothetical protein
MACVVRIEPEQGIDWEDGEEEGKRGLEEWYRHHVRGFYGHVSLSQRLSNSNSNCANGFFSPSMLHQPTNGTKHLDVLSMLPNYCRSTRYRSLAGLKPRWLVLHEMGTGLIDAQLVHRVMDTVEVLDAAHWKLGVEAGVQMRSCTGPVGYARVE